MQTFYKIARSLDLIADIRSKLRKALEEQDEETIKIAMKQIECGYRAVEIFGTDILEVLVEICSQGIRIEHPRSIKAGNTYEKTVYLEYRQARDSTFGYWKEMDAEDHRLGENRKYYFWIHPHQIGQDGYHNHKLRSAQSLWRWLRHIIEKDPATEQPETSNPECQRPEKGRRKKKEKRS